MMKINSYLCKYVHILRNIIILGQIFQWSYQYLKPREVLSRKFIMALKPLKAMIKFQGSSSCVQKIRTNLSIPKVINLLENYSKDKSVNMRHIPSIPALSAEGYRIGLY